MIMRTKMFKTAIFVLIISAAVSLQAQTLPSSFDPRVAFGKNPATSNQFGTNSCWIHSAVASAELNYLKTTGNVLKFSEPYFRYLATQTNATANGGGFVEFNPYYAVAGFNQAASTMVGMWTIMNYMLNWQGPILYDEMPYVEAIRWPTLASWNPPKLPIARAYTPPAIHVQGYEIILTTANLGGPANRNERIRLLKEAIYNNGSFVTGFNAHSMSFVGWDDNHLNGDGSRGAFLQKESWGGGAGEYKWHSYNTPGFDQAQTMSINHVEETGNFAQNYFHTRVMTARRRITGANSLTLANVFTARTANESLDAVGFSTLYPNTKFEIWVNPNGNTLNETSLIKVGEGTAVKPGFRTIRIDSKTLGAAGSQFAVAVRYTLPTGITTFDFEAQDNQSQQNAGGNFVGTSAGQSFVNTTGGFGGTWTDMHSGSYPTVAGGGGRGVNVPIRAYTGASGEPCKHDWTEWEVIDEATCEENGKEERVCKICPRKESRPIVKEDCETSIASTASTGSATGIRFAVNPVSDKAEISVVLPDNERAVETNVVIYDMVGNVVFEEKATNRTPVCRVIWDLRNPAGRFVANGTYLVVVEAKNINGRIYRYSARLGVKR